MLFYFMMLETKVFWRGAYFFRLEILLYRLSSALSALLLTMILCCEYNKDTFNSAIRPDFYKRRFLYGIQDTGHLLQRNPF